MSVRVRRAQHVLARVSQCLNSRLCMYAVPIENAVRDEIGPSVQTTVETLRYRSLDIVVHFKPAKTRYVFHFWQVSIRKLRHTMQGLDDGVCSKMASVTKLGPHRTIQAVAVLRGQIHYFGSFQAWACIDTPLALVHALLVYGHFIVRASALLRARNKSYESCACVACSEQATQPSHHHALHKHRTPCHVS